MADRSKECPNCGAPKRGAVCEYCGTHFGRYQGQASIEIDQDFTTFYDWGGDQVYKIANTPNVNITIIDDDHLGLPGLSISERAIRR